MKPIETDLAEAARNVVEHCLGIQAGEVVSIVTDSADPDRTEIARVFWEEARARGAEVILAEMLPRQNSGEEPPAPIAGTRVPVKTLWDYLENGNSLDAFLEDFPSISKKKAIGVLESARSSLMHAHSH